MITIDFDNDSSVRLCDACGGSGKVCSLTTIRHHAGEKTSRTFKHLVPCSACKGEGQDADPDEALRVQRRKLLDAEAQVRILQRLHREHAERILQCEAEREALTADERESVIDRFLELAAR